MILCARLGPSLHEQVTTRFRLRQSSPCIALLESINEAAGRDVAELQKEIATFQISFAGLRKFSSLKVLTDSLVSISSSKEVLVGCGSFTDGDYFYQGNKTLTLPGRPSWHWQLFSADHLRELNLPGELESPNFYLGQDLPVPAPSDSYALDTPPKEALISILSPKVDYKGAAVTLLTWRSPPVSLSTDSLRELFGNDEFHVCGRPWEGDLERIICDGPENEALAAII